MISSLVHFPSLQVTILHLLPIQVVVVALSSGCVSRSDIGGDENIVLFTTTTTINTNAINSIKTHITVQM